MWPQLPLVQHYRVTLELLPFGQRWQVLPVLRPANNDAMTSMTNRILRRFNTANLPGTEFASCHCITGRIKKA